MAEFHVRFHPVCIAARKWELICEFSTFPGRPCPSLKTFHSEDAILDLLANEGILDTPASEDQAMDGWYTVSAEQLGHLEVLVPFERRQFLRIQ